MVKQTLKTKINCTVASCQLLEHEFIVGLFKHSFKILFLPDIPIKFLMLLIVRYVDVWIFFYIKYSSSLPFAMVPNCLPATVAAYSVI